MTAYLLVGLGGALGSVGRFWLSGMVANRAGEAFPWGTILVNVTGSFVIGLLAAFTAANGRRMIGPAGRQFLMYGICGGYTTFSSFSLETLNLVREGEWLHAGGNVMFSVVLCMVAVWLGFLAGSALNSVKGH